MSAIRHKLESLAISYDREAGYAEEHRFRDGGATVRYWRRRASEIREIIALLDGSTPKPFQFKDATYIRLPDRRIVRLHVEVAK